MLKLATYSTGAKKHELVLHGSVKEVKSYIQRRVVDSRLKIESVKPFNNALPRNVLTYIVQTEEGVPLAAKYSLKDALKYIKKHTKAEPVATPLPEAHSDDEGYKIPSGWTVVAGDAKYGIREMTLSK